MANEFFRISDYFSYLFLAKSRHGVHSPFVYDFIETILHAKTNSEIFHMVELARRNMINSKSKIIVEDHGGGKNSGLKSLSTIASNTARQAKYGRLLYHIIKRYNYNRCLELGTGTGITAIYQAMAIDGINPLITIEGSPEIASIAEFNAKFCELENKIIVLKSKFDDILPSTLTKMEYIDLAYIDGNHKKEPTIHYFETILPYIKNDSCMVFDDIYWSEGMKQAWSVIKNHPKVTVSIDLYNFGIVFFRKEQSKENFILRY